MKWGLRSCIVILAMMGIVQGTNAGSIVGPILTISDGVHPSITVTDQFLNDLNPTFGAVTMSTNIGVWTLSIATGISKPALGSTTNPIMDLVIQASSTNSGSLTYTFSDNNFTASSKPFSSTISGHVIAGAPTTVDYSVFGNSSDVLGALTTQLATTGTNALPVLLSNTGTLPSSTLYSLSQVVQLTASGATSVSVDASLAAVVPEPSTVVLTFLGLALLVGGLAHRGRSLHNVN